MYLERIVRATKKVMLTGLNNPSRYEIKTFEHDGTLKVI